MATKPKTNKSENSANFNFGASMAELEQIVAALEAGDLELDAAMRQFERGAELAESLQKYLAKTQLKVQTIKAQLDKSDSSDTPTA